MSRMKSLSWTMAARMQPGRCSNQLKAQIPSLRPVQNLAPHGFGRAVSRGFDHMAGDAVVVMMADESDDCRDVVRYWEKLNEGYDVFLAAASSRWRWRNRLSQNQVVSQSVGQLFHQGASFASASTTRPTRLKPIAERSSMVAGLSSRLTLT